MKSKLEKTVGVYERPQRPKAPRLVLGVVIALVAVAVMVVWIVRSGVLISLQQSEPSPRQ